MQSGHGGSGCASSRNRPRRALFETHAADITRIFPDVKGAFLCPCCFRIFLRENLAESLEDGDLTVGHVWPTELRKGSRLAKRQQVLLCKSCNSATGAHGDAALHDVHLELKGQETGKLHGTMDVRVVDSPGTEPIRFGARVTIFSSPDGSPGARLGLRRDLIDPADWERWLSLTHSGKRIPAITIAPRVRPDSDLFAKAGLLSSAYLLAFYQLGYRYILSKALDPVRAFLLKTMAGESEEDEMPDEATVWFVDASAGRPHPQICLAHRTDRLTTYFCVSFHRYTVILPASAHCHKFMLAMAEKVRDKMGHDDNEFYLDLSHIATYGQDERVPCLLGPTDYRLVAAS